MKTLSSEVKYDPVIYCLALINILIHILFINNLEYHRDELLYFSPGQHPAFGYATIPPMIGWIAWLMQICLVGKNLPPLQIRHIRWCLTGRAALFIVKITDRPVL